MCHFVPLSFSLALFLPLCGKLSLNEFQIMFKCSKRHFQLFHTVILPGKLLSTHAHTDADCSVWQSIKSLWHLHCCTIIILQWIISQPFPSTGQSQGDGERQWEWHRDWDTYYHKTSDCMAKEFLQECLRACAFTSGKMNQGLGVRLHAIREQREGERCRDKSRLRPNYPLFLSKFRSHYFLRLPMIYLSCI